MPRAGSFALGDRARLPRAVWARRGDPGPGVLLNASPTQTPAISSTWYNHEHRHSGIGFHTPADVHFGHAGLAQLERTRVLQAAYAAHPERFVRQAPVPPPLPGPAWINKPVEVSLPLQLPRRSVSKKLTSSAVGRLACALAVRDGLRLEPGSLSVRRSAADAGCVDGPRLCYCPLAGHDCAATGALDGCCAF
jgi:hypothetical protein